MKIKSVRKISSEVPEKMYDVINVQPNNNFLINTKSNKFIVSHNSGKDMQMEKNKVFDMYASILGRMQSRFTINGKTAGMIFLVSSKQSEYDFLEQFIQKKKEENDRKRKKDRTFYLFDYPQWEVLPESNYPSKKKFKFLVGKGKIESKILDEMPSKEEIADLELHGCRVKEAPIELYDQAKLNINKFLMDYAGIATELATKFIPLTFLEECYDNENPLINPFEKEVLTIGLNDGLKIQDFFHPELVPQSLYTKRLFIHVDPSLAKEGGDKTGIGCVAVLGYKDQERYNEEGKQILLKDLVYRHVFSIGLQAPPGSEVSLQKTRDFFHYLKYDLGWNIQSITYDTFQSFDSIQGLTLDGFNAKVLSLDKTPVGYTTFRNAIVEKRIKMIKLNLLEKEIINLEQNNMTGKVDHPMMGSKDSADGIAGAVYDASVSIEQSQISSLDDFENLSLINSDIDGGIYDNEADRLFDFINEYKEKYGINDSINKSKDLQEDVEEEINTEINKVQELRSSLTPSENLNVTDKDLLDLIDGDSDMFIF